MIHNGNYGETSNAEGHIGQGFPINKDSNTKEMNTINSTVRTMQRIKAGTVPPEDLEVCLNENSKGIGYTVEELRTVAEGELKRQETIENTQKETDSNSEPTIEPSIETSEPRM